MNEWLFREKLHEGISYSDDTIAGEYDEHHEEFRDYAQEAKTVYDLIGLNSSSRVIDLGAGTGALTIELAKLTSSVHAVDISPEMLNQLSEKADRETLNRVTTENNGFLSFEKPEVPFDAAVSSFALHHLPDFWQQIALRRIAEVLKPGGRFFLFDVVYDFPMEEYEERLNSFVEIMKDAGPVMMDETIVHIRDENSTFSWILEKMILDAGFDIDQKISEEGLFVKYCCTRKR